MQKNGRSALNLNITMLPCLALRTFVVYQSIYGMYQSIISLTIPLPLGRLPEIGMFSLPRGLGEGGRGVELDKISYCFEKKMQELLDLFQRNWSNLKSRCCFMSIFAKTVDVNCIISNIDQLWPFRSF